jgi:hypothetical protein
MNQQEQIKYLQQFFGRIEKAADVHRAAFLLCYVYTYRILSQIKTI